MFDKMVKMKNRKGFTLIEMLIVIAVIAILVSIVVPVVGANTQKSRAATNAANLRSIEGQLSTMRVENPELFKSAVDKLGQQLGGFSNYIDIVMGMFGLSTEDLITGNSAFSQYVKYKVAHSTADENGTVTFNIGDGRSITIENVPAAKGVSVPGMEVAEGTPMTIYLSDMEILATYESGSNSYTKMDFAEVAETGEFNGTTGSGGLTEEGVTGDLACSVGSHDYVNCKCSRCGAVRHSATNTHDCTVCGEEDVNAGHIDGDGDAVCDYTDCTEILPHTTCKDTTGDYACDLPVTGGGKCGNGVHPKSLTGEDQHVDGSDSDETCDVPGCDVKLGCDCTDGKFGLSSLWTLISGGKVSCTNCGHDLLGEHVQIGSGRNMSFGACGHTY